MKALTKVQTTKTVQIAKFASDGFTPYTGITPHRVTLSMDANDEPRG